MCPLVFKTETKAEAGLKHFTVVLQYATGMNENIRHHHVSITLFHMTKKKKNLA